MSLTLVKRCIVIVANIIILPGLAMALPDSPSPNTPRYGPWASSRIWGGGYMQKVLFCPSDPNRLYCYSDVCGPFRSDDKGKTWYTLEGAISASDWVPRSMTVDPRNADNIIVVGGIHWWFKGGIYVSKDGGKTFQKKVHTRFYGNDIFKNAGFLVDRDPFVPDTVSAVSDVDGVWQTHDNGQTWSNVGLKNIYPTGLLYDHKVKNRLYVCAPRWDFLGSHRPPRDNRNYGFYRSDNGGKSWSKLSDDSPLEIVQSISHPERIYGIFDRKIIRMSTDAGKTWKDYSKGIPIADASAKLDRSTIFYTLTAGPNFILAANAKSKFFRLDDGSDTWREVVTETTKINDRDAQGMFKRFGNATNTITIDPSDPNHWFMTDWHGIWQTYDAGKNWTSAITGISPLVTFALAPGDSNNPQVLCLGMADITSHISRDGGESFQIDTRHFGSINSFALDSRNNVLYVCGGKSANIIGISKDGAKPIKLHGGNGLPQLKVRKLGAYTIAVNPTNSEVYVCISGPIAPGKGGIYASSDQGKSWKWIGNGLPKGAALFQNREFGYGESGPELVVSSNGTMICISKEKGWVFYWDSKARKWAFSKIPKYRKGKIVNVNFNVGTGVDVDTGAPHRRGIVADPFVPGRFISRGADGLFISEDGGKTFNKSWDMVGRIGHIAFDPAHKGRVVANTSLGLFLSDDGGYTWVVVPGYDKLPFKYYQRSMAYIFNNRIFVLTRGCGVFWMELPKHFRK